MASASGIRMGKVFVEIGADASKFFRQVQGLNRQIGRIGQSMQNVGSRMMGAGAALAAPFAAAAVAGARFDDVLRNVSASTSVTPAELDRVRSAAMAMSEALGVGPSEAASSMLELLKAGMPLADVLGGAGKAAIQFAKVGQLNVSEAAVVMADAMKVFGVSADFAANTLSAAADASSTDIAGITQAFSQVSAVASLANQTIGDTAAAIAVLANAGIKGSDAGTSLKTMLMRLMAPADDAVAALGQLGLATQSFRNADGTMRPLVDIIGTLENAMAGMDQAAKDDIFRRVFGQDAIRAAAVLTSTGSAGFAAMQDGMADANSVGVKFATIMGGMSGTVASLFAALERLAVTVSAALAPAIGSATQFLTNLTNAITSFVAKNEGVVRTLATVVLGIIAGGAAIYALGVAFGFLSTAASVAFAIVSALLSPIGLIVVGVAALGGSVLYAIGAFDGFGETIRTTLSGVYDAITAGDLSLAFEVLWAGLHLSWLSGVAKLMGYVDPWVSMFQNAFTILGTEIVVIWDRMVSYLASTQWGAALLGTVDNIVNGVMATFDTMVSAVRKSWNFIQSLITSGFDLAKENEKVDTQMAANARKRALDRPGVLERMRRAKEDDGRMAAESEQRVSDMRAAADATMQSREDRNRARAADREAGVAEAQQRLDELRAQAAEAAAAQAAGDAGVADREEIARQVQEAIPKPDLSGIRPPGASDSEVAGTFSAMALGGMGFGSNLQQRQLEALNRIADNTSDMETGLVAE